MIPSCGANEVARFSIDFVVANNDDLALERTRRLAPDKVRRLTIRGVVDSGAARLVLPEEVVRQLGLPYTGKVKVRYADGRTGTRNTVQNVTLRF